MTAATDATPELAAGSLARRRAQRGRYLPLPLVLVMLSSEQAADTGLREALRHQTYARRELLRFGPAEDVRSFDAALGRLLRGPFRWLVLVGTSGDIPGDAIQRLVAAAETGDAPEGQGDGRLSLISRETVRALLAAEPREELSPGQLVRLASEC